MTDTTKISRFLHSQLLLALAAVATAAGAAWLYTLGGGGAAGAAGADVSRGIVLPSAEEMDLQEPVLVKKSGRYGVKLKASAPSLHIMKVDVATEVSPIVGTEKQGEDLINFIMNKFRDNPAGIWETNMFGKSLHDLVSDGLSDKLTAMPKEAQGKMRKTVTRIVNEKNQTQIGLLKRILITKKIRLRLPLLQNLNLK